MSQPPHVDRRRKLSSRDILVIYLASRTHTAHWLGQSFQVSAKYIAHVLKNGRLRCAVCKEWKAPRSGLVLRNDQNPKIMLWICRRCIKIECS